MASKAKSTASAVPWSTASRTPCGRSLHGTCRSSPRCFWSARSVCWKKTPLRPSQGAIAPSARLFEGSGTTRPGSTASLVPRPSQAGQAPWGELKLKARGLISGKETPQSGQAKRSEKRNRSEPSASRPRGRVSTAASPSARARASSRASARRVRPSGFTSSRSTTTSRVWLRFLSRAISSSSSRVSPSTRMRRNPERRRSSRSARCSPLRPRTTGASTSTRVPGGRPSTRSTIWVTVWLEISRPQEVQWGTPTRAVEEAEVVVDLRHRAHGGAGIPDGGLLLDGDGRGQPLDGVHVGLVHLFEELAGVRRQALHVAPLPFGVERVEGQARLAGAGQPRDDDEAPPRDLQVEVLEVVLPGTSDADRVVGHREPVKGAVRSVGRAGFPARGAQGGAAILRPSASSALTSSRLRASA